MTDNRFGPQGGIGYEPRTDPAERRNFFDIRKQLRRLWAAAEALRTDVDTLRTDVDALRTDVDAIIESGVNGNGKWIKFADGTMMQWNRVTVQVVSTTLNQFDVTFPVPFVGDVPSTTATLSASGQSWNVWTGTDTLTSVSIFASRVGASGTVSRIVAWHVYGALEVTLDPNQYDFAQLMEEREWRKCFPQTKDQAKLAEGFLYFCENYWHIRHPERGRITFDLFEAQVETITSWFGTRYSLILKARQIGFSTLVATYSFWNAFGYADRPILMLSRTEREAIKLLQKSKYGYQFLPEWMKFRGGPCNMTQTKMEFTNGSYIESLPSASDPARGESAWLIVVDEMAFLSNSEEAWGAIEPVADVGGRVIMLSTANGEGNLFHKLWVGAETGNNRFEPLFFPWSANGRTQEWYEGKKRDTPDWLLAQEYPDNAEDAFLRSGRPVFNLNVLREIEPEDPVARGYLKNPTEFVEDGGALRVWEWPDHSRDVPGKYVIGADPSQGLEHSDAASVHVINARTHLVVAHWHGHIDPDLLGSDVLDKLGRFYRNALIGIESNNHGLTTLKALQRKKYRNIYYERSPRYKKSVPTDVLGYRTTQVTKPLMIDELNEALRTRSMKLLDEETIAELRTFVRDDKGKMSGSPFDDRTISLAIANQMLKHVWLPQWQVDEGPAPGTMDWWQNHLYGDGLSLSNLSNPKKTYPNAREPLGSHFVRSPNR